MVLLDLTDKLGVRIVELIYSLDKELPNIFLHWSKPTIILVITLTKPPEITYLMIQLRNFTVLAVKKVKVVVQLKDIELIQVQIMFQEEETKTSNELKEKRLVQDIRRTIILGTYLNEWGMPNERILSAKDSDLIEIYSFPPISGGNLWRIASVGMSGIKTESHTTNDFELLIVLENAYGQISFREIANFLMDIFAHSLRVSVKFEPEKTIPETHLMPSAIKPKAVLLDAPRAEIPNLEKFMIGNQEVKLLWVIPIFGNEQILIVEKGISVFDALQENSEYSLANVKRPSFC